MRGAPQGRGDGSTSGAVPGPTGPTWEAGHGQGRSPAPVVREQDQHGLLALVVVPTGRELQRGGVERAPAQALHCHQQTLVAAFVFHPVANLGTQTGVTAGGQAQRRCPHTAAPGQQSRCPGSSVVA